MAGRKETRTDRGGQVAIKMEMERMKEEKNEN